MVNNLCKYSSRNTSHTHREPSKKHFSCMYTFTKLYFFPWRADCPDLVLALFSVLVFVLTCFGPDADINMYYKLLCTMVCESGVLTIYRGKMEIPVGKSNGARHSVMEGSENMGCDLRRRNFLSLSSLFGKFGYTLWRFVLPPLACENIRFS